jgi:hypothetical protein
MNMLITWVLFVLSLGLILVSAYKLTVLWAVKTGKQIEGRLDEVINFPTELASGKVEQELIVRYSYAVDGMRYLGVDRIRMPDVEHLKANLNAGSGIKVTVTNFDDSKSYFFLEKRKFFSEAVLFGAGFLLALCLLLYIF